MPKQSPAVTLDPNSPSFPTASAAADAVSKGFKGNEQAAALIKRPDGTYGYSTVTPQQSETGFQMRLQLPAGHTLAGIVHNHPGNDSAGQVFSPDDINVATQLKVPSFIRFNKDDSLRQYVPGQTPTQRSAMSGTMGFTTAKGDPVNLPVDPPPTARMAPNIAPTDQSPTPQVVPRDDSVTQY